MSNRTPYSLVEVNDVCVQSIVERRGGQPLVLGVDVARELLTAQ